jgi:hypothetical protein
MAQILGTSPKAIQSLEQGWRSVPVHIERQVLFLMALKSFQTNRTRPCWVGKRCSEKIRLECPAWELQAGHLCWFINGTVCEGAAQKSWQDKMEICRRCTVFASVFPPTQERKGDEDRE